MHYHFSIIIHSSSEKNFGSHVPKKGAYGSKRLTSLHFLGGKGPTKEYPDPIPAVGDTVDMEHYINPKWTESNLIETNDASVQTVLTMDAINVYIHVTVRMNNKAQLRRAFISDDITTDDKSSKFYTGNL